MLNQEQEVLEGEKPSGYITVCIFCFGNPLKWHMVSDLFLLPSKVVA